MLDDKEKEIHYCYVCGKEILEVRVEALKCLNKSKEYWNCINCACLYPDDKVKGVWSGESGTSELILTNKVGKEMDKKEKEELQLELNGEIAKTPMSEAPKPHTFNPYDEDDWSGYCCGNGGGGGAVVTYSCSREEKTIDLDTFNK